jgi:hypothetical protein
VNMIENELWESVFCFDGVAGSANIVEKKWRMFLNSGEMEMERHVFLRRPLGHTILEPPGHSHDYMN